MKVFCKLFSIIAILFILLFTFSACSNRSQEKLDKAELLLSTISYELGKIADDCNYAERKGDYEMMKEELGITQIRCEDLKKTIDDAFLWGYH